MNRCRCRLEFHLSRGISLFARRKGILGGGRIYLNGRVRYKTCVEDDETPNLDGVSLSDGQVGEDYLKTTILR